MGVRIILVAAALVCGLTCAQAADREINVILPLTGNIAFVGTTQLQALKAVEAYVNKTGGIDGRQLSFVVQDDGSDVKTALQLAQGLIAKKVPLIMGSSSPQACAAIAPLVMADGPVHYCLANAANLDSASLNQPQGSFPAIGHPTRNPSRAHAASGPCRPSQATLQYGADRDAPKAAYQVLRGARPRSPGPKGRAIFH